MGRIIKTTLLVIFYGFLALCSSLKGQSSVYESPPSFSGYSNSLEPKPTVSAFAQPHKILTEEEVRMVLLLEEQFEDVSVGVERARDQNEEIEFERLISKLRLLKLQLCCLDPNHKVGCP